MTAERRRYTSEERAEAVGLALSVGVREAGRRLRIPFRTVAHWTHRDDVTPLIVRTEGELADALWSGFTAGADALLAAVRHPDAGLPENAHKTARAVEVLAQQWQLLTGRVTARSEATVTTQPGLTWEERDQLRDWLDMVIEATPEELEAYASAGARGIQQALSEGKAPDAV